MKRILVINFTRMGDIVQTSPLITGLLQKWEQPEIDLLVMKGFRSIAGMIPGVSRVLLWDQDESVTRLMREDSLAEVYRYHRDFIAGLQERNYDLIINVTHSNESAILLKALRGRDKRGILLDELGRKLTSHPWIDYFFNVTANRGFNDYNLVDIYRRIGDLAPGEGTRLQLEVPETARDSAAELLVLNGCKAGSRLVALQPGANRENRRWPEERFVELAEVLYREQQLLPLLIGAGDERELAEEIAQQAGVPVCNLAGRTGVPELAALLEKSELLVSNDTGSMHIAAAMGTPVVALFMATALPQETGAYTPDTIILQPDIECTPCSHHVVCPHLRCRQLITVPAVVDAVTCLRGGKVDFDRHPDVRVYLPFYNRDSMLQLKPLTETVLQLEQLVTAAYRVLWKGALDQTPSTAGEEEKLQREQLAAVEEQLCYLRELQLNDPADLSDALYSCREVLARVEQLGRLGYENADQLDHCSDRERLKQAVESIGGLDQELFQLEMQHQFLRPLCVLYRFNRERMHSDELAYLAREGRRMYQRVETRARMLSRILSELQEKLELPVEAEAPGEELQYV